MQLTSRVVPGNLAPVMQGNLYGEYVVQVRLCLPNWFVHVSSTQHSCVGVQRQKT
jgi:hypothetical protein